MLADLAVILLATRVTGGVFVRLGQPRVVGELIAGVLIGPTVLGGTLARAEIASVPGVEALAGSGLSGRLYPLQALSILEILAQLGLVFFMFLVGLEVERRLLRNHGREIVVVGLAATLVPALLGFAVGGVLDGPDWKPTGFPAAAHVLIVASAFSISALPVVALILREKGVVNTAVGINSIGAAALTTPLSFFLLAGARAASEGSGAGATVARTLLLTVVLVAVLWVGVRPLLAALLRARYSPGESLRPELLALLLIGTLATALASDRIGVTAFLGAFLFGATVPEIRGLAEAVFDRMAGLVDVFLIPIFLAVAGIQTNFRVLGVDLIPGTLLFLAVMIAAKWLSGGAAGRAVGLSWSQANSLGVLLNCRGLMILVVAFVAGELGGITPQLVAVISLGSIITTLMTGPLVDLFTRRDDVIGAALPSVDTP